MQNGQYGHEEIAILKSLFDTADTDRTGKIHINQLPGLLMKLGKNEDEIGNITEAVSKNADDNEGLVKFDDFISVLETVETFIL